MMVNQENGQKWLSSIAVMKKVAKITVKILDQLIVLVVRLILLWCLGLILSIILLPIQGEIDKIIIAGIFFGLISFIFSWYFIKIKDRERRKYTFGIFAVLFFSIFFYIFSSLFLYIQAPDYFTTLGVGEVAPGITKAKILSLKIGMDKDTVIDLLGDPIYTTEGNDLIYATSGLGLFDMGFEISLDFSSDNKLIYVQIKRDDRGVYSCSQDICGTAKGFKNLEKLFSLSAKQEKMTNGGDTAKKP